MTTSSSADTVSGPSASSGARARMQEQLDRLSRKASRPRKPCDQPMQAAAYFVKQRSIRGSESIDPMLFELAKQPMHDVQIVVNLLGDPAARFGSPN